MIRRALTWLSVRAAAAWVRSLRVRGTPGQALPSSGILVLWHADMLPCLRAFAHRDMRVLVSRSADGDFAAAVARRLGYRVVRGSSSRGGVTALRALARALGAEGGWVAFVADGPRGPRAVCKPGPVWLAEKTGLPVVAVRAYARYGLTLGGWARVRVPWPGTRVALRISSPFRPGDPAAIEAAMDALSPHPTKTAARADHRAGNQKTRDRQVL